MKRNLTTPVGTDGDPSLDPGPDPGIGNVRGIRGGIEEDLEVGRTNERGIGMRKRGTQTGRIGAETTERVVRVGMEVLTVRWRNAWASDPLALHPPPAFQTNKPTVRCPWVNPLPRFSPCLRASVFADRPFFVFFLRSPCLILVVHHPNPISSAVSILLSSLPSIRFIYPLAISHLQGLYIMVIISSYLTIYLRYLHLGPSVSAPVAVISSLSCLTSLSSV